MAGNEQKEKKDGKAEGLLELIIPYREVDTDTCIDVHDSGDGRKNVLIAPMSTINTNNVSRGTKYTYEGYNGELLHGYGQLAVVPKYIDRRWKKPIHKIIILASSATRNTKVALKINDEEVRGYTAVELFERETDMYFGYDQNTRPDGFYEIIEMIDEPEKESDERNRSLQISDSQSNLRAIERAAKVLRDLAGSAPDHKLGELWIASYGALRDASVVLVDLIQLLTFDGIDVDQVIGTKFNQGGASTIIDVTETYFISEFVAGMKEFINYGSVRSLNSYFDHIKDGKNSAFYQLLKPMGKISNGLMYCDYSVYEEGVGELCGCLSDINKRGTADSLYRMFRADIEKDYGSIIGQQDDEAILIRESIKRCVTHKMFQQAVTFAETKMPYVLVDKFFEVTITWNDIRSKTARRNFIYKRNRPVNICHSYEFHDVNRLEGTALDTYVHRKIIEDLLVLVLDNLLSDQYKIIISETEFSEYVYAVPKPITYPENESAWEAHWKYEIDKLKSNRKGEDKNRKEQILFGWLNKIILEGSMSASIENEKSIDFTIRLKFWDKFAEMRNADPDNRAFADRLAAYQKSLIRVVYLNTLIKQIRNQFNHVRSETRPANDVIEALMDEFVLDLDNVMRLQEELMSSDSQV